MFPPSSKNTGVFFRSIQQKPSKRVLSQKKLKRKAMKKQVHDPGGPGSAAARKKTKDGAEFIRKGREKEAKMGGPT
jgi:hypothetical protein